MNPALTAQLSAIRTLRTDLHQRMADLDGRIVRVERLAQEESTAPEFPLISETAPTLPTVRSKVTPPPLPPAIPRVPPPHLPPPVRPPTVRESTPPAVAPLPVERVQAVPVAKEDHALEMRVGTYWLARIGILLLLTGLVFLGNFAWHSWVPRMGSGGKLGALTASGLLLSLAGMWVHRGAAKREGLRNYSLVLIGGGLATLYYAAYGAYFIGSLKVIGSPIAGGTLLLGMAALIVWVAEKWRSETVALLAVLLSFYTSAMNPIAEFSLFSNLLLAGTAIWFLSRHHWAHLTYASLVGSYAAFGFWRVFQEGFVVWGTGLSEPEFWTSRGFLLAYWILFTVAFCMGGARKLPPLNRVVCVAANNAAFLAYSGPALHQFYPQAFWILPFVLGIILIGLSRLSRRRDEPSLIESGMLAQGLALLLLGIASKLTGYSLALCVAVEAVMLLWFSGKDERQAGIYRLGAAACSVIAAVVSWSLLIQGQGYLTGLAVAAVFLFMAWMNRRILRTPEEKVDPAATALSLGALITVVGVIVQQGWPLWQVALTFIALASACFGAWKKLRMPEAAALMHILVVAAAAPGVKQAQSFAPDAWLLVIGGLSFIGMSLLWKHRQFGPSPAAVAAEWGFAAAGSVILLLAWSLHLTAVEWIAAGTGAAVVWFAAGLALRSGAIGVWSQVALGTVFVCLAQRFAALPPSAWLVLGCVAVSGFGAHVALKEGIVDRPWQPVVRHAGALWRIVTAVLLARLLWTGVDASVHVLLAIQALGWLMAGRHWKWEESTVCGLILSFLWCFGGFFAGFRGIHTEGVILSALIMLAAVQWVARRRSEWFPSIQIRHVFSAASVTVFAAAVTGWVRTQVSPSALTAAWSVLGCCAFGVGLLLKDRAVRWTGLAVLALALGRIFFVDVWQLPTLGRIVSFLALGCVLLAIGFIYNRFADRIARWL